MKKITLGEHQIPHLMNDDHYGVFGHPSNELYDGLHMRGPAGRQSFQESVLNILKNVGIYKARQDDTILPGGWKHRNINNSADGWKTNKHDEMKTASGGNSSSGEKPHQYDHMGRMIQRIRAVSNRNRTQPRKEGSDEVFCSPKAKVSVIKPTKLQDNYSVPVANSFDSLGN